MTTPTPTPASVAQVERFAWRVSLPSDSSAERAATACVRPERTHAFKGLISPASRGVPRVPGLVDLGF